MQKLFAGGQQERVTLVTGESGEGGVTWHGGADLTEGGMSEQERESYRLALELQLQEAG